MRITGSHVLTMASAALFCGPLTAQSPTEGSSPPEIAQIELKPGDVRASNLLGAMVKRLTGDSIGQVEELIVSADADVRLAVISVGGILGLGAKTIAVPFDEFMVAPDGSTVYLSISEDELSARPAFDLDGGDAELQTTDEPATPETQTAQGSNEPIALRAEEAHAIPENSSGAHGALQDRSREGNSLAIKSKATKQPARALVGAQVVDDQNRPIGRINDLVVTAEPPEVQVVLELGGESASSRFVAVPLSDLTISRGHGDAHRQVESVEMSLTASQLDVLPTFAY